MDTSALIKTLERRFPWLRDECEVVEADSVVGGLIAWYRELREIARDETEEL